MILKTEWLAYVLADSDRHHANLFAAWLNELTGDDIELAALADFMFRTQASTGPDFDPTAPRAKRELARREWIKAVTGR